MGNFACKAGLPRLPVRSNRDKAGLSVLDVPRSRLYPRQQAARLSCPRPAQDFSAEERTVIRALLNSERFMDKAPRQIHAALLDEGTYLCHWRTMYRILNAHGEVHERRLIRRHPTYKKPELLAEAPNEV